MKKVTVLFAIAALLAAPAFAADYNLGELARSNRLEVFNRTLDQAKAGAPEVVFLNSAGNYGLAWVTAVAFSKGTIEVEIKGRNKPGSSFVEIAFHGQDNKTFDAVYLRPFNFQAADSGHRSHSIQYISMPAHDWDDLRMNYPGEYEAALIPAPSPESWVGLKLVVEDQNVTAFVNGASKPALSIDLLNSRHNGKLGLWVGNGSDGWFKNLQVTQAAK